VSEHIVSPKIYLVIFLTLMAGTAITVWAAFQNFGKFNIVIALAIATFKATLVVLYFMHARYSPSAPSWSSSAPYSGSPLCSLSPSPTTRRESTPSATSHPGDFQSRRYMRKSRASPTVIGHNSRTNTPSPCSVFFGVFWGGSAKVIGGVANRPALNPLKDPRPPPPPS